MVILKDWRLPTFIYLLSLFVYKTKDYHFKSLVSLFTDIISLNLCLYIYIKIYYLSILSLCIYRYTKDYHSISILSLCIYRYTKDYHSISLLSLCRYR